MSANVWNEQVDIGLLNELRKSVKITNESGELVALNDNAFVVRKPEEDFKVEQYPCVSIYNRMHSFDSRRYFQDPIIKSVIKDENTASLEESAIPFNLSYQIDFWSEYQTEMNDMTMTWLLEHYRQFNLPVVDDGGVARTCNVLSSGNGTKSDLVVNKERLFHTIFLYDIWVELDNEIKYNKGIVGVVNIDTVRK